MARRDLCTCEQIPKKNEPRNQFSWKKKTKIIKTSDEKWNNFFSKYRLHTDEWYNIVNNWENSLAFQILVNMILPKLQKKKKLKNIKLFVCYKTTTSSNQSKPHSSLVTDGKD